MIMRLFKVKNKESSNDELKSNVENERRNMRVKSSRYLILDSSTVGRIPRKMIILSQIWSSKTLQKYICQSNKVKCHLTNFPV